MKNSPGKLYIVATPIGNWDDITLRAKKVLDNADILICEEIKVGSTLLKKLSIPQKELISLNEHNEENQIGLILQHLSEGKDLALISDCGTPVFADPGHALIHQAHLSGIEIIPIPGPSSLMAILSVLDFKLEHFHFAGFLPREKETRKKELNSLRSIDIPIVLMDTPYRLTKLLEEVMHTFGKNRKVTLGLNITQENEKFLRGAIIDVIKQMNLKKAEFVLIIHGKK